MPPSAFHVSTYKHISHICTYMHVNVHTKFMHTHAFMPPPPKKKRERDREMKDRGERSKETNQANHLLFLPEERHTRWGRQNMNKVVRAVWWG